MPRHNNKGRTQAYNVLPFSVMCRKIGITPMQRIQLIRYAKLTNKQKQEREVKI